MFAHPLILSILTTRRCTAACDHCAIGSSPKAAGHIPVERIHRLIEEATRIPSIRRIVFTGGECFLLGRELDAVIAHAHRAGFETRAITNGYWAVNPRAAATRVAALTEAGLDEVMFSTGTFHQRFVPVERVLYAARATASAGIATRISVEACDQSTFDRTVLDEQLADLILAGAVKIAEDPWIPDPGGRGEASLSHQDVLSGRPGAADGRCQQIFTVISVTPDQVLTACCGFPMEQLPSLRIGSVTDRSLDEVVAAAPNELLKMWLHVAGPAGIARFVARHLAGYELPAFASICQACVALQRDRRAMRVLAEHAAEVVESISAEFVRLQASSPPSIAAAT